MQCVILGSLAMLAAITAHLVTEGAPPKEPKRRKPLGVRRSSNLGFGPSSGGVGGMGEPPSPPKDSTAHAPTETIMPLYSTDYLFVSFSVQAERCNFPRCLR
jgi:hypothetical protein